MSSAKEQAAAAKTRGNAAFTSGQFEKAVEEFTAAIGFDPSDHIFYSNRSGAYASLKNYDAALKDADECIKIQPTFVKGYSRRGAALFGLEQLEDAIQAYEDGLKIDPNNAQLKEGLESAQRELERLSSDFGRGGPGGDPFAKLFGPDMFDKLSRDPSTSYLLADAGFRSKMQAIQANPKLFTSYMQDPQVSAALGVLLGIGPLGGRGDPEAAMRAEAAEEEERKRRKIAEEEAAKKRKEEEERAKEEALPDEEKQKIAIKKQAQAEKDKGNELYKKKQFDQALAHYDNAISLDPTNITFLNNKAAVYFEQKDYDRVLSTCKQAIAIGAEHNADFRDRARAWERIGNVHAARGSLDEAIQAYESSLLEDHNDKVKTTLKKLTEQKKINEANAYLDSAKSEEAKERGNQLYKEGKFIPAIEEYSEALKRDPKNFKVYTNRANCYSKLMEWNKALNDCEKALQIDPTFVKAYIRKGKIHHFLKQYHKALEAYERGLSLDASNAEILDERRKTIAAINSGEADPERAKRAMEDPEIQNILRDPTINKVLQDLQQSPQTASAALKDPDIKAKIEKLVAAGVLQIK